MASSATTGCVLTVAPVKNVFIEFYILESPELGGIHRDQNRLYSQELCARF